MKLTRYEQGSDFLAATETFLQAHEVAHFLLLALPRLPPPTDPAREPYFAAVFDGATVVAATVRTPPHSLALSRIDASVLDAAIACIRDDLRARNVSLPLIVGPVGVADRFAEAWVADGRAEATVFMRFREFEARKIEAPPNVAGAMRIATQADLDLLYVWAHAFIDEARLPEEDRMMTTRQSVSNRIDAGRWWFWEMDGQPVAMASTGGTVRVPRIGPVYTPDAFRRRGYASALVAALSQQKLDGGCVAVALSTDLTNPTSNRIYQAIGYRPVGDSVMLRVKEGE